MIFVRRIIYYVYTSPALLSKFLIMNAIFPLRIKCVNTCVHFDFVDWFSSLRNSTKKKWNANQLQNACKNISGTVPKFNNKLELKSKMNCSFPGKNRTHWTALRYKQVNHKRKR